MKKLLTFIMACVISLGATAQISEKAFEKWHQNKYSMFIHFGLYSELGGVWEGNPVTRGYSEQIQSFAGIFSDWYGDTALRFNPTLFDGRYRVTGQRSRYALHHHYHQASRRFLYVPYSHHRL